MAATMGDLVHAAASFALCRKFIDLFGAAALADAGMVEYFDIGQVADKELHVSHACPTVAELRAHKKLTLYGSTLPCFGMLYPGGLRKLNSAAAEAMGQLVVWINDEFSVDKERAQGEQINMLLVLEAELGSAEAARRSFRKMVRGKCEEVTELLRECPLDQQRLLCGWALGYLASELDLENERQTTGKRSIDLSALAPLIEKCAALGIALQTFTDLRSNIQEERLKAERWLVELTFDVVPLGGQMLKKSIRYAAILSAYTSISTGISDRLAINRHALLLLILFEYDDASTDNRDVTIAETRASSRALANMIVTAGAVELSWVRSHM